MTGSAVVLLLLCQSLSSGVTIFGDARAETLRYRFENPSRLDTVELVPHFFEQTYDTDNVWLGVAIRHPLFATRGRFEAAATPAATRRADDFDTFYQPNGNVVVSGTTGNATLRSLSLAEAVEIGRWRGLSIGLEYSYRRDRAEYHEGDGIVTTTIPPAESHRLVTTREIAVSQVHAVNWVAGLERSRGANAVGLEVRGAPVALGRLTVELPDKYPGRVLAYHAKVAMVGVTARYDRWFGGWGIGAIGRAGRSFNWTAGSQMHLSGASVGVELTRRRASPRPRP